VEYVDRVASRLSQLHTSPSASTQNRHADCDRCGRTNHPLPESKNKDRLALPCRPVLGPNFLQSLPCAWCCPACVIGYALWPTIEVGHGDAIWGSICRSVLPVLPCNRGASTQIGQALGTADSLRLQQRRYRELEPIDDSAHSLALPNSHQDDGQFQVNFGRIRGGPNDGFARVPRCVHDRLFVALSRSSQ
jgi:hypothetical protein